MTKSNLTRRGLMGASLLGLGGALSGCVTLLPETKPVQLYTIRFNPEWLVPPAAVAPAVTDDAVDVFVTVPAFPRAAAGDRILTSEGNEVSYVSGGRWATSAQGMFRDVLSEGFAREGNRVRLANQGRIAAKYRLDVEVRRFETAYARRRPTVVVTLDARLVRTDDRSVVAERYITVEEPVRRNNIGTIVEGFERASTRAVAQVIAFSEEATATAKSAAPETAS
ncbi:MAG: ABC-type transport auxiliary lipoprotein family protein [Asticcacaulis sp.]